jgi:hypothetical protein
MFDSTTIGRHQRQRAAGWPRNRVDNSSAGQAVTVAAAFLFEAILIMGIVVATLGLGFESQTRVGPDRPPAPMAPAPGPPAPPTVIGQAQP